MSLTVAAILLADVHVVVANHVIRVVRPARNILIPKTKVTAVPGRKEKNPSANTAK